MYQTRIPEEAHPEISARARAAGMSASQYIADTMMLAIGRPDLVRELNREEGLPLAI